LRPVDLNADLGEGVEGEEELLPFLTSASLACGLHAGGVEEMDLSLRRARELGVTVGAHPGFPDRESFGRLATTRDPGAIFALVLCQLGALDLLARSRGVEVRHVKPHGALYHLASEDREVARAVASAVRFWRSEAVVFTFPGSFLEEEARRAGLRVAREGFADRRYGPDGRLLPRGVPGAIILDPEEASEQALGLVRERGIDTLCVHGDTPGAAAIARRIRERLEAEGYELRPPHLFLR
jgi:UPF0271 protein